MIVGHLDNMDITKIEELEFDKSYTYDELRLRWEFLNEKDFGDLILRAVRDKLIKVSGDKIFRISRKKTNA